MVAHYVLYFLKSIKKLENGISFSSFFVNFAKSLQCL